MSTPRQQQGGLSITTLAIASAASVAAAIVVHEVWRGGAILGAALTPVIVAVVSESLKRPVDRVSAIREERRTRTGVYPGRGPAPPPPELERADPFGIWQEDRRPGLLHRLDSRHLKLALATGGVAFVIGAIVLTGTELVFGGNIGGGGKDTTIFQGGGSRDEEDSTKTETTETEPTDEQSTDTTETAPPADEAPPADTTTTPPPEGSTPPPGETVPPATTPTPPEPAPAPAPEETPPAQPVP